LLTNQGLKLAIESNQNEQLRTEFNEQALAGRAPQMERDHRPVGEQAIALMRIEADSRALDVGCGPGWATRLMADYARHGRVTGIDISDEMVRVARESSASYQNVDFEVANAEQLPFAGNEFTHAFSMESLYYYNNIPKALKEIHRVLKPGGLFVAVFDMYWENEPTHQWVETLNVPAQLLSIDDYRSLFADAGFEKIQDQRLIDPRPHNFTGGSCANWEEFVKYRQAGRLMVSGEAAK
jgi:SAM-dependent methyltransferase